MKNWLRVKFIQNRSLLVRTLIIWKRLNCHQNKENLREQIINNLSRYNVEWDETLNRFTANNLRQMQFKLAGEVNARGLQYKDKVERFIAKAEEIDISKVNPYLEAVNSSATHARLWAYATSFWSIPVTTGYGRRIRFFVFDKQNNKLIGIVGLADPIIGLGVRDNFIGWTKDQKLFRLYNSMTAYILGAIPPYNLILGAKLVALTLMFPDVRKAFYHKYKDTTPIISKEQKKPYLVYIDTLGAFGKSAIYTRLQNWKFVGYTKGQSHLHITANGSWETIKAAVPEKIFNTYKYGQGPNWKIRVLRTGLKELGFSEKMLSIGWKRGYYACPLAENWQEFLCGKSNQPKYKKFTETDLVEYWKKRMGTAKIREFTE